MENGNHRSSFISNVIEHSPELSLGYSLDENDDIKATVASLYVAGAETTSSALSAFILAMVMFPDMQHRAQEEIDRIIGTDRLPKFKDRENLPYIEGIIKEIHRWHTVTPMGLPHVSNSDLVYDGYYIPQGAYLLPAIWWFNHDPEVYTNPESFDPERYLEPRSELDPTAVTFGFGRRVCPGQYYADSSVFITAAYILAAYTLNKAMDENGVEIEVNHEVTGHLLAAQRSFHIVFTQRVRNILSL